MDTGIAKLPTLAELTTDQETAYKNDAFNALLCAQPPAAWVKELGHANDYKYLPIDKVEYLLRRIFKQFKIEITGQGTAFNGVWMTVRVHYLHPVSGEWMFHDGVGAEQLQTKKGTSVTDLANINSGTISMAFPKAKSAALSDACDHFGDLFGANLNRKNIVAFTPDKNLQPTTHEALSDMFNRAKGILTTEEISHAERVLNNREQNNYTKLFNKLETILKAA